MPSIRTLPVTSTEVRLAEEKLQKYSVENTETGMRRIFFGEKFKDLSNINHQLKEFDIVKASTLHAVARDFTLHVIQDARDLFMMGNHRDSDLDNCLKDLEFAMVLLDREKLKTNGFIGALKSFLQNLADRIKGRHVSESDLYEAYQVFSIKVNDIKMSGGASGIHTDWMKFFKDLELTMTKSGYKVKNEGSVAKAVGNKALAKKDVPASVQGQSPSYPELIVKGKRVRKYPVGE